MKILVLADEECRSLWDYYKPGKLKDIEMIISCGDLNSNYLQFLVTFGNCPLLYVRGNHDSRYDINPPDGCVCIEDKIYNYKGLRIAGLGGSRRYKPGPDMYTEKEMSVRVRKLWRKARYWTASNAIGVGSRTRSEPSRCILFNFAGYASQVIASYSRTQRIAMFPLMNCLNSSLHWRNCSNSEEHRSPACIMLRRP